MLDDLCASKENYNSEKNPKIKEVEKLLGDNNLDSFLENIVGEKYRSLQYKVHEEQKKNGETWLVSNLITLGSPLTYSDLLLAEDKDDLKRKQNQRELPMVPPTLDKKKGVTYRRKCKRGAELKSEDGLKTYFHNAAMFALTRWTNISFLPSKTIFGDIISGPLQPLFGYGIKDVFTKTKILNGLASHTNYWSPEKGDNYEVDHILKLREALDLLNRDDRSEEIKEIKNILEN